MRTFGLLRELSEGLDVELIILARRPLTQAQEDTLGGICSKVTRIALRDRSVVDRLRAIMVMLRRGSPYHCALLEVAMSSNTAQRRYVKQFPGVVFTSHGLWGTLIRDRPAHNWILNQCDAEVEFWRAYAAQARGVLVRLVARVSYFLTRRHMPRIYGNVGCIISVCEEDRLLTRKLAPDARVEVVENGVDCTYYTPLEARQPGRPHLLFTGTAARRNVAALRDFAESILPLIAREVPGVELVVAGDFDARTQRQFRRFPQLHFTGVLDDLRPVFIPDAVFVAPFRDAHGSKLKIAEAMAMGLAIVTTPPGARGFPVVEGESVVIARSNEHFAAAVVALLADASLRERIGARARAVAVSCIDWRLLGKRLRRIVNSVASELPLS